jgi:hypothetical protein
MAAEEAEKYVIGPVRLVLGCALASVSAQPPPA